MMNKKVFVKLIALLMAAAMLLGVCACSATDNNPTIGKIGKVKIKLSQYQQIYQQYSYYAKSMDDFNGFIKNQLITYGVTLNKCYELGLDKEISQDELQKNVDAKLDQAIASYKVDASITDEAAIRENKLEQFKAALKKQGTSYKAYMKSLKQSELESMMMEMLQEKIYSEVQFDASAFEKYISENTLSQRDNYGKDVSAFMTAYNSYISGSGMIPLYTPNDMFTVKHLLVQYDNSDKVSDTVEGVFTDEQNKKLDEIRKALESGISLDEFVDKYVTNGDYQSDTVFVSATPDPSATPNPDATPEPTADPDSPGGYKEHGYIMNENLLSKYFDGFGAAACLLSTAMIGRFPLSPHPPHPMQPMLPRPRMLPQPMLPQRMFPQPMLPQPPMLLPPMLPQRMHPQPMLPPPINPPTTRPTPSRSTASRYTPPPTDRRSQKSPQRLPAAAYTSSSSTKGLMQAIPLSKLRTMMQLTGTPRSSTSKNGTGSLLRMFH